MEKPIAESCLRNQQAIYETLRPYLVGDAPEVFEIGSGTGQHAVFIADQMPKITWQPSDVEECLSGITAWARESHHKNVKLPVLLDVDSAPQVDSQYDVVFTANTIHFVSEVTAKNIVRQASRYAQENGYFLVYGPFKSNGEYTSEGDKRLDAWLKSRDPASGIRDRQWLIAQAEADGLAQVNEHPMPANNFILVFQKQRSA